MNREVHVRNCEGVGLELPALLDSGAEKNSLRSFEGPCRRDTLIELWEGVGVRFTHKVRLRKLFH